MSISCYKEDLPLKPSDWATYLKKTKNASEPRNILKIGLEYLEKEHISPGLAVDLGTGTGRDTLYLLRKNWKVLAIDYSQEAINILLARAKTQKLNKPEIQITNMTQMQLPKSINLVNASYSLPFINPKNFPSVWENIIKHIPPKGLFIGNFFGPEDSYVHYKNVTILNELQLYFLLKAFKILYIHEDKKYSSDSTGSKTMGCLECSGNKTLTLIILYLRTHL